MAKIAKVRFSWSRSVSADVVAVKFDLDVAGTHTVAELPVEAEEFFVDVPANSAFALVITVTDSEGLSASTSYSNVIPDLEAPRPVTGVAHQIVSVTDVA